MLVGSFQQIGGIVSREGWRFYLMGSSLLRTDYYLASTWQKQASSCGQILGPRTNVISNRAGSLNSDTLCSPCLSSLPNGSLVNGPSIISPFTIEFIISSMGDKAPRVVPIDNPEFPFVCENGDYKLERQFLFDIHRGNITENDFSQFNEFQKGVYFFVKREYAKAEGSPLNVLFLDANANFSKDYPELSIENVKKAIEKICEVKDKLNFIQAVWECNIKYVPNQNNFRSLPEIIDDGRSGDCDDYLQFFIDMLFPNENLDHKIFINNTSSTTFHVVMAIQDKMGDSYYLIDVKKPIIRYHSINFLTNDFTKRLLEVKAP